MKKYIVLFLAVWATTNGFAQEKVNWDWIDTIYVDGVARSCVGNPENNGKWGLVDKKGNTVLEPTYESMNTFSEGISKVSTNWSFRYIDTKGKIISKDYAHGDRNRVGFINGFAMVCSRSSGDFGFINRNGTEVIEPQYSFVDHFNESGYARVWTGSTLENQVFYPDFTGSKIGLVDSVGNVVIELGKYNWISYGLNANLIIKNEGKLGIISVSEKVLLSFGQYTSIETAFNKYYIVTKEQNGKKYGVLDKNLNVLIPIKYESITALMYANKTAFWVELNDKYGLVDENDKIIAPFKYDWIGNGYNYSFQMSEINRFPVRHNDKVGWIDINGQEVIPCIYEDNSHVSGGNGFFPFGLTVVAKRSNNDDGYKYGIIDTKGQIILPIIYERAYICSNNSISVLLNGKSFSVDRDGIKRKDLKSHHDCD